MWPLGHSLVLSLVSLHVIIFTFADGNTEKENGQVSSELNSETLKRNSRENSATKEVNTDKPGGQDGNRLGLVKSKIKVIGKGVAGKVIMFRDKALQDKSQTRPKPRIALFVDSLHRKTYETAGNLYEMANPTRYYWGKAWNVMSKISLEKLSKKEQLNAIVSALTDEITQVLPQSASIDPIEVHSRGTKYICGLNGKISDLRTIKHVSTRTESKDDVVNLYITYSFDKLFFTYDTFYINILKVLRLRGKLIIRYSDNQVTLTVGIPSYSKLLVNVLRKNCLLHVKGFQTNILKYDECDIEADSEFRRGQSKTRIGKYLMENEDMFKSTFEREVLVEIHRALVTSGGWICKDSSIAEEVHRRGGTLNDYVPSPRFRNKCM